MTLGLNYSIQRLCVANREMFEKSEDFRPEVAFLQTTHFKACMNK
jgi:hypothetical protein